MTEQEAVAVFESMGYIESPSWKYPYFNKGNYMCAIQAYPNNKIQLNWFYEDMTEIRFYGLVRNAQDILLLAELLVID